MPKSSYTKKRVLTPPPYFPPGQYIQYTPTVGAAAGSLQAFSTGIGWYAMFGKTMNLVVYLSISGPGTGSGYVTFSLPSGVTTRTYATFAGQDITNGFMLLGYAAAAGSALNIYKYDGTFPVTAACEFRMNGYIETT